MSTDAGLAWLAGVRTRRWLGKAGNASVFPDYDYFAWRGQSVDSPPGQSWTSDGPVVAPSGSSFFVPNPPTGGPWNTIGNTPEVLGTSFTSTAQVQLSRVHFYKDPADTGLHVATVWQVSNQTKLAQVTFTGETASGWQSANLVPIVTMLAGVTYLVTVSHVGSLYGFLWAFPNNAVMGPITLSSVAYYEPTADPNAFPSNTIGGYYYLVDITAG